MSTGIKNIGGYIFIANTQHIIEPIKNFFSKNILISITGYLKLSSLFINRIKHKVKIVKHINMRLEKNQSFLSPSSKNISKDIKLVANNSIPLKSILDIINHKIEKIA